MRGGGGWSRGLGFTGCGVQGFRVVQVWTKLCIPHYIGCLAKRDSCDVSAALLPKGPCTQIVYTLGPMYPLREYFKAKVYTIWVHGPLWPEPNAPRTHRKPHEMLIRCGSFMRRNSSGCGRSWRNAWPCLCTWPAAHTNTHNDTERERENKQIEISTVHTCVYVSMYICINKVRIVHI